MKGSRNTSTAHLDAARFLIGHVYGEYLKAADMEAGIFSCRDRYGKARKARLSYRKVRDLAAGPLQAMKAAGVNCPGSFEEKTETAYTLLKQLVSKRIKFLNLFMDGELKTKFESLSRESDEISDHLLRLVEEISRDPACRSLSNRIKVKLRRKRKETKFSEE